MSNKVLITSCPRSGSKYISVFLTKCGKDFPHENPVGKDGLASWIITPTLPDPITIRQKRNFKIINDRYVIRKPLGHCEGRPIPSNGFKNQFDMQIHQIRHPLKSIASMLTLKRASLRWTSPFIPYPEPSPLHDHKTNLIRKYMYFWYYWNNIGIQNTDWYYQVENLIDYKENFCNIFSLDHNTFDEAYKATSKKTNRRIKKAFLSWEDLREIDEPIFNLIKPMAESLGYE